MDNSLTSRWIDLATEHFPSRVLQFSQADLGDFVSCFHSANRFERKESERFHCFSYEELQKRNKPSLDVTWLRDESLEDTDNFPDPAVLAAEIVDDLQAASDQFALIGTDLNRKPNDASLPSRDSLRNHFKTAGVTHWCVASRFAGVFFSLLVVLLTLSFHWNLE